jgi:JNK-interacting protein 3
MRFGCFHLASRLEEKETELKLENGKLHNRYNELLRSQCDLMERMKILVGNDDSLSITGPQSLTSKPLAGKKCDSQIFFGFCEEPEAERTKATSLIPRQAWVDTELSLEDASIIEDVDDMPRDKEPSSLSGNNDCILLLFSLLLSLS